MPLMQRLGPRPGGVSLEPNEWDLTTRSGEAAPWQMCRARGRAAEHQEGFGIDRTTPNFQAGDGTEISGRCFSGQRRMPFIESASWRFRCELKQLAYFTSASQHPREVDVWFMFSRKETKFKQMLKYHQCDTDVTARKWWKQNSHPNYIPCPKQHSRSLGVGLKLSWMDLAETPHPPPNPSLSGFCAPRVRALKLSPTCGISVLSLCRFIFLEFWAPPF